MNSRAMRENLSTTKKTRFLLEGPCRPESNGIKKYFFFIKKKGGISKVSLDGLIMERPKSLVKCEHYYSKKMP